MGVAFVSSLPYERNQSVLARAAIWTWKLGHTTDTAIYAAKMNQAPYFSLNFLHIQTQILQHRCTYKRTKALHTAIYYQMEGTDIEPQIVTSSVLSLFKNQALLSVLFLTLSISRVLFRQISRHVKSCGHLALQAACVRLQSTIQSVPGVGVNQFPDYVRRKQQAPEIAWLHMDYASMPSIALLSKQLSFLSYVNARRMWCRFPYISLLLSMWFSCIFLHFCNQSQLKVRVSSVAFTWPHIFCAVVKI